jgi:V8-like Glu-specific endopeptidase
MYNWKKITAIIILAFFALPVNQAAAIISPDRPVFNNEALWTARITFMDPYQKEESLLCSGVLVSPTIVLTAAHCLDPDMGMDLLSTVKIHLGAHNISDPNMVAYKPSSFVYHNKYFTTVELYETLSEEDYPKGFDSSDIGIITLAKPVKNIKPITLPSKNYKAKGTLRTFGWGMINEEGDMSENLLTALQYDLSKDPDTIKEYKIYDNFKKVIPATAILDNLSIGTCYGDSGGPLVDKNNILVGITSWANTSDCSEPMATIFTKISEYRDWIQEASAKSEKLLKTNICIEVIKKDSVTEAKSFISEINELALWSSFFRQDTKTATYNDIYTLAKSALNTVAGKFSKGNYTSTYNITYKVNYKKGKYQLGPVVKDNSSTITKNSSKVFITGYEKSRVASSNPDVVITPKSYKPTMCLSPKKEKPNKVTSTAEEPKQDSYNGQASYYEVHAFVKEINALAAFTSKADAANQVEYVIKENNYGSFEFLSPTEGIYTTSYGDKYSIIFDLDTAYFYTYDPDYTEKPMVTIPDLLPLPVPPVKPPAPSTQDGNWIWSYSEYGETVYEETDNYGYIENTERSQAKQELIILEPYIYTCGFPQETQKG